MSEQKRKLIEQAVNELTKTLTDKGRLIEAGYEIFRSMAMSKAAPQIQIDEMRLAFMAGAEHLFGSIMNVLDPGTEPTDDDLRRMDLIATELDRWRAKIAERIQPAKGSA